MSIHDNHSNTQKTALLVGGTSESGQAICKTLVDRGYRCTVHGGKHIEKLHMLQNVYGKSIETVQCHAETPDELCSALEPHYAVDLLCIVYGPMEQKPSEETNPTDWTRMMDWNYALPVTLTLRAAKRMKPGGMIVYFTFLDEDVQKTFTHTAAYATAKQSLTMFIRQIASVLHAQGIRCFGIAPDFIDSEMISSEQRNRWRSYAETGKLLESGDIARTLAWILDAPAVVNALILPIKKW